jgi:hypothetical protein
MFRYVHVCTLVSSHSEIIHTLMTGIYALLYSLFTVYVMSCPHLTIAVPQMLSLWRRHHER